LQETTAITFFLAVVALVSFPVKKGEELCKIARLQNQTQFGGKSQFFYFSSEASTFASFH